MKEIDMKPPDRPLSLPLGVDWNDLGDMVETRRYKIEFIGFEIRWYCLINGNFRIVAPRNIFTDQNDPSLGEFRKKARESFRKYALS
jgi:hypothetical protein